MWRGFNPLEVEKIVNKRRMDRNTIIGFLLIFGLLIAWQQFMKPSEQQLAAEQQLQDSLRQEQLKADSLAALQAITQPANDVPADSTQAAVKDSLMQTQLAGTFGPFATAAAGKEQTVTLENDLLRLAVSTKGGRIVEAEVKNYKKVVEDEKASGNQRTPAAFGRREESIRISVACIWSAQRDGEHRRPLFRSGTSG
jgi:YidC/Oxa1 family membrane protein insertase